MKRFFALVWEEFRHWRDFNRQLERLIKAIRKGNPCFFRRHRWKLWPPYPGTPGVKRCKRCGDFETWR